MLQLFRKLLCKVRILWAQMRFHCQLCGCAGDSLAPFKISLLSDSCSVSCCLHLLAPGFPEEPFNKSAASSSSLGRLTFPKCLFPTNSPLSPAQIPRLSSKGLLLWLHGPGQTPSLHGLRFPSSQINQTDSLSSYFDVQ